MNYLTPTSSDPGARARALGPAIEAAAEEIEQTQRIPEPLLSAPREQYRDASHLARNAQVSPMSASRLVRQLDARRHHRARRGR